MRELARTLVTLSGPEAVHGVIPAPLVKHESRPDSKDEGIKEGKLPEYRAYGKTKVVKDMHSRRQMMIC